MKFPFALQPLSKADLLAPKELASKEEKPLLDLTYDEDLFLLLLERVPWDRATQSVFLLAQKTHFQQLYLELFVVRQGISQKSFRCSFLQLASS